MIHKDTSLSSLLSRDMVGHSLDTLFIIKSVSKGISKKGSEFARVTISDRTATIEAMVWDIKELDIMDTACEVYRGLIEVGTYHDTLSYTLRAISRTSEKAEDYIQFAPSYNVAKKRLSELLNVLDGTVYGEITLCVLRGVSGYKTYPAARSIHHAEFGGLLAHSVSVADIALRIGESYCGLYGDGFVNIPLLVAGGLLHDIGKLEEYAVDRATGNVSMSDISALKTHMVSGLEILNTLCKDIPDSKKELELLKHIIASHHGRLEWGALTLPAFTEAAIISQADFLDSKVDRFRREYLSMQSGEARFTSIYETPSRVLKV